MNEVYKIIRNISRQLKKEIFYLVPVEKWFFDELDHTTEKLCSYNFDLYYKDENIIEKIDTLMLIYYQKKLAFSVSLNLDYYKKIRKYKSFREYLYEINDYVYCIDKRASYEKIVDNQLYIFNDRAFFEDAYRIICDGKLYKRIKYYNENLDLNLSFSFDNNRIIDTSIHAFIGRNGCGKTYLMNNMVLSLISNTSKNRGIFSIDKPFDKIIMVSMNQYDDNLKNDSFKKNKYTIIRSDYFNSGRKKANYIEKNNTEKLETFESKKARYKTYSCIKNFSSRKKTLFKKAISIITTDPSFNSSVDVEYYDKSASYYSFFSNLSSGNKRIVSVLVSLINEIEDDSFVFLDEPENGLYPGLIPLYTKSLKIILNEYNSAGFIFTHSPLLIQQLPSECVWKIKRRGNDCSVKNVKINVLGENIGLLINDLFDIEIEDTIYNDYINIALKSKTTDFEKDLGDESKAILYALRGDENA